MDTKRLCTLLLLFSCENGETSVSHAAEPIPISTGFDFPVGNPDGKGSYISADGKTYNGWRIAADFLDPSYKKDYGWYHPAEDWNGVGGGNTDFGQPVHAVSRGRVIAVCNLEFFGFGKGIEVAIEHVLPDARHVYSVYSHMDTALVTEGQDVGRREQIGTIGTDYGKYPAHLHLEIRNTYDHCFSWPGGSDAALERIHKEYLAPSPFINDHRSFLKK